MATEPLSHFTVMRSQLGRVRGLGSAQSGVSTWWMERLTAIALIPLTLWFVRSVFSLLRASRLDVQHWLASPFNAVLMLALIVATFHHLQLGLQVVIEDYVHTETTKTGSLLVIKGISFLLALACIISVLKLYFSPVPA